MKFFWAWIFRLPLVWLIDHDGGINLRRAHVSGLGKVWVHRHPYNIRTVFLGAGGVVRNGSYVIRWEPANKPATQMFKETA